MEGIWAVIFVIALGFRIYKKFSESMGKASREWQDGNKLPDFMDVDREDDVAKPEYPFGEKQWESLGAVRKNPTNTSHRVAGVTTNQQHRITEEIQTLTPTFLDHDNVINGIIMAELLQPPKCKGRTRQHR